MIITWAVNPRDIAGERKKKKKKKKKKPEQLRHCHTHRRSSSILSWFQPPTSHPPPLPRVPHPQPLRTAPLSVAGMYVCAVTLCSTPRWPNGRTFATRAVARVRTPLSPLGFFQVVILFYSVLFYSVLFQAVSLHFHWGDTWCNG